jgi:protein-S-isoprenylcysteine O-methyltransferase Ste14
MEETALNVRIVESVFIAAFPVILMIGLISTRLAFRRRNIDMEGAPPIDPRLLYPSKVAMLVPWAAMFLQSCGVNISLSGVPRPLGLLALSLWALGFLLAIAGRFGLGSSFRVGCPKEETVLKTGGIFRLSRNPIYLGLNLTFLASALYTLNPVVLLVGAASAAVHHRIILAEEECLRRMFGAAYDEYCLSVRRYL